EAAERGGPVKILATSAALRCFVCATAVYSACGGCSRPSSAPVASATAAAFADNPKGEADAPSRQLRGRRAAAAGRPVEAIDRVLLISIDGLRPDVLLRAFTPRIRALCAGGSYTFWAETTHEAYTLPCHVTMLTGAPSEKHGVTWNQYIEDSYPNVPTRFELAQ